jgi:F420-dependent oxidoreductase-like protein
MTMGGKPMGQSRIGVAVTGPDSAAVVAGIQRAEEVNVPAAWLVTGGAGLDGLTIFAAAAVRTERIMLGTAITPTFPRHPVVAVQQVQVLAQLAPGRFRLGIGPSGKSLMEDMFGSHYRSPLGHLREYLRITRALLQEGAVDFDGRYYKAHAQIPVPMDVPVMASALGPKAYELCGAEADGAISWVCPGLYLRDIAVPAMKAGADRAGRPVPPLVAHAPVCVHENADEVRAAIRQQFGFFAQVPHYQAMFTAAGFPETSQGAWSDGMIDGVALWGNESQVEEKLKQLLSYGATEIIASPVPVGDDQDASLDRTLSVLGRVASEVAAG